MPMRGLTWEAFSMPYGSCHEGFQEAVQRGGTQIGGKLGSRGVTAL